VRTAQALSFLSLKAEHDGDLQRAVQLRSESAAIVHQAKWRWWEAHDRASLAALERRRGNLAAAMAQARESAALAETIHDRMMAVFAAAELASAAAVGGQAELAGRLWGAIEAEEEGPPIGQWPAERAAYEEIVRAAAGTAFERGRDEGRLLSLADAANIDKQVR
ncbi:MAG: hypothetical protein H0U35_10125, partial [Sporichthyaceae bacterium]|nr:hypothetical protein [Sporichthyaceae bacterium]